MGLHLEVIAGKQLLTSSEVEMDPTVYECVRYSLNVITLLVYAFSTRPVYLITVLVGACEVAQNCLKRKPTIRVSVLKAF